MPYQFFLALQWSEAAFLSKANTVQMIQRLVGNLTEYIVSRPEIEHLVYTITINDDLVNDIL